MCYIQGLGPDDAYHRPTIFAKVGPRVAMCGGLLCGYTFGNVDGPPVSNCFKWVDTLGAFVKAAVILQRPPAWNLCWSRDDGVLLLGQYRPKTGDYKGRF